MTEEERLHALLQSLATSLRAGIAQHPGVIVLLDPIEVPATPPP